MTSDDYKYEVVTIRAKNKGKQLLRLLCVGVIFFGIWSLFTTSGVIARVSSRSELFGSIPQQTMLEMSAVDGLLVVAAGILGLHILTR